MNIEITRRRLGDLTQSQIELLLEGLTLVEQRCPTTQVQDADRFRARSMRNYLTQGAAA